MMAITLGFEKLLKKNPKSAKGQGPAGVTPLMYAALYGLRTRCLQKLLDQGADPNTEIDLRGDGAVMGRR